MKLLTTLVLLLLCGFPLSGELTKSTLLSFTAKNLDKKQQAQIKKKIDLQSQKKIQVTGLEQYLIDHGPGDDQGNSVYKNLEYKDYDEYYVNIFMNGKFEKFSQLQTPQPEINANTGDAQQAAGGKALFTIIPKDVIFNGAFNARGTFLAWGRRTQRVKGWNFEIAEICQGQVYNEKWGNQTNVAKLDVEHNVQYDLYLQPEAGIYYAAFDWAPDEHSTFDTSQLEVAWNGVTVSTIRAEYNEVFTQLMVFKAHEYTNRITLRGAGKSDDVGATFSNFRVFRISDDSIGDYETTAFKQYDFTMLNSFERLNIIEGKTFVYNGTEKEDAGIEEGVMGINSNSSVTHSVTFDGSQKKKYLVSFDFFPHKTAALKDSEFRVFFNGEEVFHNTPNTHHVRRQYLKCYGKVGDNSLTFRGEGSSGDQGVSIRNVEVLPMTDKQTQLKKVAEFRRVTQKQMNVKCYWRNLNPNGDFHLRALPANTHDIWWEKDIAGWYLPEKMQYGAAEIYNKKWTGRCLNTIELDGSRNQNITKILNLTTYSSYFLSFDWAPKQNHPLETSQIEIRWNGDFYTNLLAYEDQIFTQSMMFKSSGHDRLNFAGGGASDGNGATICNLQVFKAHSYASHLVFYEAFVHHNLIKNGDFRIFRQQFQWPHPRIITPDQLPHWYSKSGKIGQCALFNPAWSHSDFCVQLDIQPDTEYTTIFMGNYSSYLLRFEYATSPKSKQPSRVSVHLNGQQIANLVPNPIQGQTLRHFLILNNPLAVNSLTFTEPGSSDGMGATISNVQVHRMVDGSRPVKVNNELIPDITRNVHITRYTQELLDSNDFGSLFGDKGLSYPTSVSQKETVIGYIIMGACEVGPYSAYNKQWINGRVMELDGSKNCEIIKILNVPRGDYYVTFDWAAREGCSFDTSQIELRWNGFLIANLIAYEYEIITQLMAFKTIVGSNLLSFKGAGPSDSDGATIQHIHVFKANQIMRAFILYQGYLRHNLIKNGDFQTNSLGQATLKNITSGSLPGWHSEKGFVGKGHHFNSHWPADTTVIGLRGHVDTRYTTFFPGKRTSYVVSFDFAARGGFAFLASKFKVFVNGIQVLDIIPENYEVQRQYFVVDNPVSLNTLTFIDDSPGLVGIGPSIDNVEVNAFAKKSEQEQIEEEQPTVQQNILLTIYPQNLAPDGNFSGVSADNKKIYSGKDLPGWVFGDTNCALASYRTGNRKWKSGKIVNLDYTHNCMIKKKINLTEGNYYLSFNWAPKPGYPFETSQIELRWNGMLLANLLATQNQIFSQSMAFRSTGEVDYLSFMGAGPSDGHGSSIQNLRIFATSSLERGFSFFQGLVWLNLVVNGDFERGALKVSFPYLIPENSLPGWKARSGKAGQGSFFNSHWDAENNLVRLDSRVDTMYFTLIQGNYKHYVLSFDFAPQENESLDTSQIGVYYNDRKILHIIPDQTYEVQRQFIVLNDSKLINTLMFKGEGPSDGIGAGIDNIEVHRIRNGDKVDEDEGSHQEEMIGADEQLTAGGEPLYRAISFNLLENGDFSDQGHFDAKSPNKKTGTVKEWEVDSVEVGLGSTYNENWGSETVAKLDIGTNVEMNLHLKLYYGDYYAMFDWAAQEHKPMQTSSIDLRWNGVLFRTLIAADMKVYTQLMVFITEDDVVNKLTLTGNGKADGIGATFSNVRVYLSSDQANYLQSLPFDLYGFNVLEGYSRSNLIQGYKLIKLQGILPKLEEVLPSLQKLINQTEDRLGSYMSTRHQPVANSWAKLEFGVKCFTQFSGEKKIYLLTFDFVTKHNHPLSFSRFSVMFNGEQVLNYQPITYHYRHQWAIVYGKQGVNTLSFRGEGYSDIFGVLIDNVELHELNREVQFENFVSEILPLARYSEFLTSSQASLLENGKFEGTNPIYGWEVGSIKIASPPIRYNSKWKGVAKVVAVLDHQVQASTTLPLPFGWGGFYLSFDWAPYEGKPFNTSEIQLQWNGVVFARIVAAYDDVFTQLISFKAINKINKLSFHGAGIHDGYGATFSNVKILTTSDNIDALTVFQSYSQSNLFEDEGFFTFTDQNKAQKHYAAHNHSDSEPKSIALTNDGKTSHAMQFTASKSQVYLLSFVFVPPEHQQPQASKFIVYFNDRIVFEETPSNNDAVRKYLKVAPIEGINTLAFLATGPSNKSGVALRDVQAHLFAKKNMQFTSTDDESAEGHSIFIYNIDNAKYRPESGENEQSQRQPLMGGQPTMSIVPFNLFAGNFQQHITFLAGEKFIYMSTLYNWEVGLAEIGQGDLYNSLWGPNTIVADLDSKHNTFYQYTFNQLQHPYYYFSFQWAPNEHSPLKTSQIELRWDGKLVYAFQAKQNLLFLEGFMINQTVQQIHSINISGAGESDGSGATIANFELTYLHRNGYIESQSQLFHGFCSLSSYRLANMIVNGDFEDAPFQVGIQTFFYGKQLSGWTTSKGEVGYTHYFNNLSDVTDKNHVINLDAKVNTNYQTIVNTGQRQQYYLSFDYTACTWEALDSSKFMVTLNDGNVFSATPDHYFFKRQYAFLNARKGNNTLTFYGLGASDGCGALIDNVEVHHPS